MDDPIEAIGGPDALRAIVDDFVTRFTSDVMIGFFFKDVNIKRLKELEYQHIAAFFDGKTAYRGRPLDEAHQKHPIMGGQFARRLQILREVLGNHNVPEEIAAAWIAHNESLRPLVTNNRADECKDPRKGQT